MHTVIVTGAGLVLLGVMIVVARAIRQDQTTATAKACAYFIPLWAAGAATNMAVGVLQAGYAVSVEAPIFLLVFGVPAVIAYVVLRKVRRQ